MDRELANDIAMDVIDRLKRYCKQMLIAGGFRRGKWDIHDIDIVIQPDENMTSPLFGGKHIDDVINPIAQPHLLSRTGQVGIWDLNGEALKKFRYRNVNIELWIADGIIRHYETLALIRTGSQEFTKCLAHFAKVKQWTLHAGGAGLCSRGHWKREDREYNAKKCDIIETKEKEIIEKLLGKYYRPSEREQWVIPEIYVEADKERERAETIAKNTGFYMRCPCNIEWTNWREWYEHREAKHPQGQGLSLKNRVRK